VISKGKTVPIKLNQCRCDCPAVYTPATLPSTLPPQGPPPMTVWTAPSTPPVAVGCPQGLGLVEWPLPDWPLSSCEPSLAVILVSGLHHPDPLYGYPPQRCCRTPSVSVRDCRTLLGRFRPSIWTVWIPSGYHLFAERAAVPHTPPCTVVNRLLDYKGPGL
jgi:hypothetical protein